MRRYVDTFVRYWGLVILPILLLPLGDFMLMKTPPTAYGTANIWVDQTSLQQLSYVDQGVPPAQNMTNYLSQLLLSQSFDLGVARQSPLYWRSLQLTPDPQGAAVADLSKDATATPAGPNLVTIAYVSTSPAIAMQVVAGILNETSHEISSLNQQQASKDVAYYTAQLQSARARYGVAAKSLGNYMTSQGISSTQLDLRQLSDAKLATLYQAVQSAQTDVTNIEQELSKTQTQAAGPAAFRVIDPPAFKVAVVSKKKQLTGLAIPLVVGLLLSGAFVVIKTAMDRSLRYVDEVPDLLGLPVLAVVPFDPELAAEKRRKRGAKAAKSRAVGEG